MTDQDKPGGDPGYIKTDRRVSHQPEAPKPEEPPAPETEQQPEAAPADAADHEPNPAPEAGPQPQTLADVGVYGVLRFCVSILMEQAWVALGLHALPGRETQENLPEAKVAIDALTGLVAQLQPDLDPAEKQELESGLANLRINFVRRVG